MSQETTKAQRRQAATIVLSAVVLAICYRATLAGMVQQWWIDEDLAYGFIVPFVIGWIIWRERERLRKLPAHPTAWGFAVLAIAGGMEIISALGVGLFAGAVAFVVSLIGIVLCFGGFGWIRALAFPLVLTLFMLPKLAIVYNQITLPLQLLATRLAGAMLSAAGFTVSRAGNVLNVAGHSIAVVEACNGIRYLLPLLFLALVFAYTSGARFWVRAAMLTAAIPTAIVANAFRVAVSGLSPALTEGTPHALLGVFIFVLCLATIAAIFQLIVRGAGYNRICKRRMPSSSEPGTTV